MNENEILTEGAEATPEQPNRELDKEQSRHWEKNHKAILAYVRDYMRDSKATPTVAEIASWTGLTRATVYKHLQGFSATTEFAGHASIFKIMVSDVVRQLYYQSTCGHIPASRLYLEIMGVLKTGKTVNNNFINPQNNLKINNVELTEEVLQGLGAEQLKQIEDILTKGKIQEPVAKPEEVKV